MLLLSEDKNLWPAASAARRAKGGEKQILPLKSEEMKANIDHFQVSYNLTMEKATLMMSPDFEVVDVNDYDILLTDIKGETIRTLEIDGSTHLSEAQTSIEQVSVSLNGVTYGDYSRVLVRAVLSAKQKSVNAIMLVDTGSPYTFLTDETFKALGINLEEQPSDQAFIVLVNAQRTKAHLSKAHFEEVNVLGTNFLDFCELQVNYPKKTARITIVPV
jgi:hypothetical protein